MRKLRQTIGLALSFSVAAGCAVAGAYGPHAAAKVLSDYEILNRVREAGLGPTMLQPIRRGPYYVLHAIDLNGIEMRVVGDVQLGDIVSAKPVRPWVDFYLRDYVRAPHIIHVRQGKNPNDTIDEAPVGGFPRIILVEPAKAD